jgi:hypothetical protein
VTQGRAELADGADALPTDNDHIEELLQPKHYQEWISTPYFRDEPKLTLSRFPLFARVRFAPDEAPFW